MRLGCREEPQVGVGGLGAEKKGVGEVVVSKILTEVGVKMATPWGRIRGGNI